MRIKLLFNTVRQLKPIQIFYQLRYKLVKAKPFAQFTATQRGDIEYLSFEDLLPALTCAELIASMRTEAA